MLIGVWLFWLFSYVTVLENIKLLDDQVWWPMEITRPIAQISTLIWASGVIGSMVAIFALAMLGRDAPNE